MQSRPKREGFELPQSAEEAHRLLAQQATFALQAALITHNGNAVISDGVPLNPGEQAHFNDIATNYHEATPERAYTPIPGFAGGVVETPTDSVITQQPIDPNVNDRYLESIGS